MKNAFEIARYYNTRVATLKDSQLYLSRQNGRELRALAAEAVETPIVGTAKEIGEKYGKYFNHVNWSKVADHDPEEVFVWAFDSSRPTYSTSSRQDINIVPIDVVEASPEKEGDAARKRIGKMIREKRVQQHMSIRDLATAAGVSKNNVDRVEAGKYNYTIDVLSAIAGALCLDVILA